MSRLTRTLLAGFVLALPAALLAAEPPAGNYKVTLPLAGNRIVGLLKLESADGKWAGTMLAPPNAPEAKVEGVKVAKDILRFTVTTKDKGSLVFEGRVPTDKDAKIYGTFSEGDRPFPVTLGPTTLTSLDPFDLSREALAKATDPGEVMQAALICLSRASDKKAKPDEAKGWADKALKAAEVFGPKWKRIVVFQIAEILSDQDRFSGLALEYAEKARAALDKTDDPNVQRQILTLLADALDKAGRKEDAKAVRDEMTKIALVIVKPFAGRKGKSDRTVLVELFTCAEQPACVAPDNAFAALLQTYKPSEVVLLQYHINQPGPDPLANSETETRARAYEVRGSPNILFNGSKENPAAGGSGESQSAYDQYNQMLVRLLDKPAPMKITATATRTGQTINIKTDVTDLAEPGPDIRLRVALVEETVAYTGGNRASRYVQVVRHFAGGVAGTPMKAKSASNKFSVELDTVRKNIKTYLDRVNENKPFPNKDRPLDLKKLRVVAFVQNDETGEILNAVQVDVKGE